MKNMFAKAGITYFDHENTCWEQKCVVLAIEICICPWKFCTLPMKICFDNIVRSRPPYIPKRTILSNQNLWAKLYFCIRKPRVHGQNFIFIVCLHLQTAFSWSNYYFAWANLACVHKRVFMGNLCICICRYFHVHAQKALSHTGKFFHVHLVHARPSSFN